MSRVVLDASALLALVNQELGQDVVAELLSRSLVSAVNASELVAKLTDQGMPEGEIQEILAALNLTVVPFDEEQGLVAGYLRAVTKHLGLSLGDRACLALGLQTQCLVVTADKAWAKLNIGIEIQVIR
ncbi:type II toxin-antitoxin system VapC family toxin [Phormidium tenue]|uniref:VapC toxin family PIN domain ribonuclease n=1 Tax=Phormidium tenue NIES-30 TaxID=549789 RepID=A0A1U7J2U4_9CYAN|nr:type II toxin-antitoxin system VapC family toxin [Phormidium tenue]MBD2233273.1 type II toxin-antitoxin system VapC family toxin [Phormidium tenue FACHB-1052]OKH46557.1 VapC toxin family PIN domain ribonuclease [Phormidium tenue NIES-30]